MTAFFCPGKLGDACLQLPVARAYAKQHKTKVDIWLDSATCKPLVPLCESQDWVESVKLVGPSKNYNCGGQPWDGDFTTQEHLDQEIISLGFRQFPQRQITLETVSNVPVTIELEWLKEATFHVEHSPVNRLVLHGTFASHHSGTPGFWRFLNDHSAELAALFEEVVFVGTPDERARALEVYPGLTAYDDQGSFLELAKLISGSRCVIGAGSSVVALASVQKVPTIRVHDPIGDYPKVIWSGLGDNQLNETERDLRELWPAWRDRWLTASEACVIS